MRIRRMAATVTLLGSWLLVQLPEKDMSLTDPGHPLAPIANYTKLKEFDAFEQCEFYRATAIQDAMNEGSQAMSAQAARLRCVSSEQGAQATPGATVPSSPSGAR